MRYYVLETPEGPIVAEVAGLSIGDVDDPGCSMVAGIRSRRDLASPLLDVWGTAEKRYLAAHDCLGAEATGRYFIDSAAAPEVADELTRFFGWGTPRTRDEVLWDAEPPCPRHPDLPAVDTLREALFAWEQGDDSIASRRADVWRALELAAGGLPD